MFDFIFFLFLCLLCAAVLFILTYWVVYCCYTLVYVFLRSFVDCNLFIVDDY